MMKKSLLLTFTLVLSLVLVACGTNADTADGADAQAVDLSQSASYEDEFGGTVNVNYPEGWFANAENGSVTLATSETLLESAAGSDFPEVAEGDVVGLVLVLPPDMVSFFIEDGVEPSAVAIADSFASDLANEDDTVGEVEETTIGDQSAAVVSGTADGASVTLVAIDLGDGTYAVVYGGTGEGGDVRATIEAIAGSITYTMAE